MLKTVNIRALKDKFSAYLRDVQAGDVVLVTDRGRVVAELRQPTLHGAALDEVQGREQRLVERGILKRGLPNDPAGYGKPVVRLSAEIVDAALAATRGDE